MAEHPDIPSVAAIRGHPLHPLMITLPVAFLSAPVATDFAYLATKDPYWRRASKDLLAAGVGTGMAAAGAGLIDFISLKGVREHWKSWVHLALNTTAVTTAGVNWLTRDGDGSSEAGGNGGLKPYAVVLSLTSFGAVLVAGLLGGDLAHRHKISVQSVPGHGQLQYGGRAG